LKNIKYSKPPTSHGFWISSIISKVQPDGRWKELPKTIKLGWSENDEIWWWPFNLVEIQVMIGIGSMFTTE
jgi:UDP:flavonoid glycosyltransferase YjiC (YdhE family)